MSESSDPPVPRRHTAPTGRHARCAPAAAGHVGTGPARSGGAHVPGPLDVDALRGAGHLVAAHEILRTHYVTARRSMWPRRPAALRTWL